MQLDSRLEPEIIAIFGLGSKIRESDFNAVERLILKGIPFSSFKRLRKLLRVPDEELAQTIGVRMKDLRPAEGSSARLPMIPSDRLYRVARLFAMATRVFGDCEAAADWLRDPRSALGGRTPLSTLLTEPGAEEVESLLGRIVHGVVS